MEILAKVFIAIVAIEHIYILYMEMFAWETLGRKTFKGAIPDDMFPKTKSLAANQGLYNGFLAAGLIWSFLIEDPIWASNVALFFLGCVIIAAIYGSMTAAKKILIVQGVPAMLAFLFVYLAR